MNKKAIVDITAGYIVWLLRLLIATGIIIFIFAVAAKYLSIDTEVGQGEFDATANSIIFCLTETPGVIDTKKIDETTLGKCFYNQNLGYKVTLRDLENKIIQEADLRTVQQRLDVGVCQTKPEVVCATHHNYILYDDNQQGYLDIEVIQDAE